MNAQRARRREAERIRQVARRRRRRRRLATAAALTLVLVAGLTGLAARLRAIGLPPLRPAEGTAVHIHQHLDLYVDGAKAPVPAGIGIDPAVGFAPLHTHDASGVIHVESPTVRGDPTALTLASHQEIVVAFGTATQLPSPVPSDYRFPPGL
jgi:hypothetical protein